MVTALIFIIVLGVLIFVHELGHFLAARASGVRVDAFKLGFGPKVFAWKRGETEYGLNLIPFGGYVKIFGENPDDESINGANKARSFVHKSWWRQVSVLVAGVCFNFIFAWLLYTIVFTSGVTATVGGFERYTNDFQNQRVMVTNVSKDSPAEKSGIEVGDVIVGAIASSMTQLPDSIPATVTAIQDTVNSSKGSPVTITVQRKDGAHTIQATPTQGLVEGKYAVGIGMDTVGDLRLPVYIAVWEGLHYTYNMIGQTIQGLGTLFMTIFKGTANFSDISGPVGIAGIVGNAAQMGFTYLLMITALISINLGVINLLPFPALDGGRTLFVLLETLFRRKIPTTFVNVVNLAGFALLMILMIVVTFKDIVKLIK